MSTLIEIYDSIWKYLVAHPVDGTSAGFIATATAAGYTRKDIDTVSSAVYPELMTRMVIKVATFESVRDAFNNATDAQCIRVIGDVRASLVNGPFKLDQLTTNLNLVNANITIINRQLTNSVIARKTIVISFPDSQIKTDTLAIFDLGLLTLNRQKTNYTQLVASLSDEINSL